MVVAGWCFENYNHSLLGPLLYVCYSNDMEMTVNCTLILYAGDSIIMISVIDHKKKNIKKKILKYFKLNWQLNLILQITGLIIENKLSLHPGKCESMVFNLKKIKCKWISNFNVELYGTTINSKSNIQYLGSVVGCSLSGQDNVSNITKKSNSKLKFMLR